MRHLDDQKGFTLLELILCLSILALLTIAAAPQFKDVQEQAKEMATRKILSDMRSAIIIYRAKSLVDDPSGSGWPSHGDAGAGEGANFLTQVLGDPEKMPGNPYHEDDKRVRNSANFGDAKGTIGGGPRGWCYNEDTGEFWANSNTVGENTW